MSTIELAGKQIEVDSDGNLKNLNDWNEETASEIAKLEGIEKLTDRHWLVINFMRKEFMEKGDGPTVRRLTKESGVGTKELYALFPKGPAKKAARIGGIPKPKGCI
ncbi:MAG: TusE/DsrC/DsvC family sulfur relay protein [Ignavibacteria bacterium]|nr:TusE/DsrC/DsvC family sulfur relay protein [Ignavibacteria bacterium]